MATTSLGDKVLDDAKSAAADGNYQAAYHLLMAAVHIADKDRDMDLIRRACDQANEYGKAVDAAAPDHRLSTKAAKLRGQTPLFEALQIHANAVVTRQRVDTDKRLPGFEG